jgi:hypothetical protein
VGLIAALAACSAAPAPSATVAPSADGPSASASAPAPSPSATPWPSVELPPFPGSVGATGWQSTVEPPPGMGPDDTTYDDPAVLLDDLAVMVRCVRGPEGPNLRAEFLFSPDDERALALIQVFDLPDDSVAGTEYVVTLQSGTGGWYVAVSEQRAHCRRGVDRSSDLCV